MTAGVLDLTNLSQRFLAAQLAADRSGAVRLLLEEGIARGATVPDLLLGVIRPAQREIGALWQQNQISIADEHQATAIAQLAVAQLYRYMDRAEPTGCRIVLGCVEGEQHEMGARIAADLLDADGHDVIFLGPNVPTDSLVDKVRRERPHLVALSITMTFHADALRRAVAALRADMPGLPIAAGGSAFAWSPALAGELGLEASGEDARGLVHDVRRFLAR